MLTGKYGRKAVALAGVLAVALIGVAAVGLWAGAAAPASTEAALVDAAAATDHDAGVCLADPLEDVGSATTLNGGLECHPFCHVQPGCTFLNCCCWLCGSRVICQQTPLPG